MKKAILLLCLISLGISPLLSAQEKASENRALVDELMAQTGQSSARVGEQYAGLFIQQMTGMLKQSNPNIDPRAFSILQEEIRAVIQEELVDKRLLAEMMYPIYERHFTTAELKQMIELNKTPLGKKIIEVTPLITQESMQAAQSLGQTLGPIIQQRVMTKFQLEGIAPP